MKQRKSKYLVFIIVAMIAAVVIVTIGNTLKRGEPTLLQGVVMVREYKVASKIPGRIKQVYVSEGERVDSGVLLYSLATPELDSKLAQASAAKQAAQALDREVLSGARRQQIDALYNLWQRAKAGRELAEKQYNRCVKLSEKGVITAQQLDEATANFEAMKASESAAYAEYSLAKAGATKNQKSAAAAQVEMAQGAVAEVESYISDSHIFAPTAGEISTIAYYAGEIVGSGFPVMTLLDLDDIWVEFNIKESLLPQITIGKTLHAYIPALDKAIPLIVSHIAAQADFAIWSVTREDGSFDIRTFVVKMRPAKDADAKALRAGMSAIIRL